MSLTNRAGGKTYFSLAILPDASERTLALFARHAHAHVVGTKVEWRYDPKASTVTSTFRYTTRAYEAGEAGTLFALYPHQWRNTRTPLTELSYGSVRGLMKLGEGDSFVTASRFFGVLPALPMGVDCDKAKLAGMIKAEADSPTPPVRDTYAEGKWLGKLATLIPIAEQCGADSAAETMRTKLKTRLEQWLNPREPAAGSARKSGLFYYDRNWGNADRLSGQLRLRPGTQ